MDFRVGDFLLVNPGTQVPPNGRYSRGIILDSPSHYGLITVAWHDGKINSEIISNITQYYTVIPQ
jgi:hypothetical protein